MLKILASFLTNMVKSPIFSMYLQNKSFLEMACSGSSDTVEITLVM